jgi:hypothetical protein
MSDEKKKDCWDKAQIITNCFAVVVLGFIGGCIDSTLKRRDSNVKMIEVAVGVLRSKPDETSGELRNWAMDVINQYSEVKITERLREVLKTNRLPASLPLMLPFTLSGENGETILDESGKPILLESNAAPIRGKQ